MSLTELHRPVECFLGVVWPYDKLWKYFLSNFLSNAPTFMVIQQSLKDPAYLVQKVHFTSQKKNASFNVIARKKYAILFSIRPLDFSLQIRKDKSKLAKLRKSHDIQVLKNFLEKQQKSGFSNLSVHFSVFFAFFFFNFSNRSYK